MEQRLERASVSHQLYGTAHLHFEIQMSGIAHLNNHAELYVESISSNSWANYVQQMSNPGTWCDNIIIQAVANAHNCVIHITESDINKPQGTIITPVFHDQHPRVIFIGYINDLHYVSTMPYKTSINKSRLAYLKRKLLQSDDQKTTQLDKRRKSRSSETNDEREKRWPKNVKMMLSEGLKKQIRTDTKGLPNYAKIMLSEGLKKQIRTESKD